MAGKILWLCSWYPHDADPFDGDFIQRHAEAVSRFHPIDVLHVSRQQGSFNTSYKQKERNAQLTEHLYSISLPAQNLFYSLIAWIYFFRVHLRFLRNHPRPELIHVHVPMKAGLMALWFRMINKIPYLLTEHYGIYNVNAPDHFKKRNFLFRFATRHIVKHAEALTTVSHSLGREMNDWVWPLQYEAIPNVVNTELFSYTTPPTSNVFQFIHISSMIPLKNVEGILEAVAQLATIRNDFKLLIVGSVDEGVYQQAQVSNLIDRQVFFKGELPYADVAQHLRESKAMILFSDTESQSCVVLESLCCGRPAIVTNVGGVKELINETNGYKVDPRDVNDLKEKMIRMIDHYADFDLKNISNQAVQQYSYKTVGKQFSSLYEKTLQRD